MTRKEAEFKIYRKLKEIVKIAEAYCPNVSYLDLRFVRDLGEKYYSFSNSYWDEDKEHPINSSIILRR